MSNRLFAIAAVLWMIGLGASSAATEWEEVKLGPRSYVTLDSFAQFYRLVVPPIPQDGFFELRGEGKTVSFRPGSRETILNGRKAWLSFPLAVDALGRILVPKVDVILLFDPLIRERLSVPPRPFMGVVIDPGHGGADNGAKTREGYMEKEATLDTALLLEKKLKAEGIPTVLTRRTDIFITLEERARFPSKYPGYVFVSIHFNSGPRPIQGVETFALSLQGTPSTSSEGILRASDMEPQPGNRNNLHNVLLTGMVHREIAKMHSTADDRGLKRARFVVLRENPVPAVLVEGGFMSNSANAALISSVAYREKLAEAITVGLQAYVREVDPTHAWISDEAVPIPTPPPIVMPAPRVPQIPLRNMEIVVPVPPLMPEPPPQTIVPALKADPELLPPLEPQPPPPKTDAPVVETMPGPDAEVPLPTPAPPKEKPTP